jgi:hypothetical protein
LELQGRLNGHASALTINPLQGAESQEKDVDALLFFECAGIKEKF